MSDWWRIVPSVAIGIIIGMLLPWPKHTPSEATELGNAGNSPNTSSSISSLRSAMSGNSSSRERKAPTSLTPEEQMQADLSAVLLHPAIVDKIYFSPISESLKVKHVTLKSLGLEKYGPGLDNAVEEAKNKLRVYDRSNVEALLLGENESVYLIPGDKSSSLGADFERSVHEAIPDPAIADFILKKTKENISSFTGDFLRGDRIIRLRSLGPGDEGEGYPKMQYAIELSMVHSMDTKTLRAKAEQSKTPEELKGDWIPAGGSYRTYFETPPEYLRHMME